MLIISKPGMTTSNKKNKCSFDNQGYYLSEFIQEITN